ncbi:putative membrane protein [Candidatus Neoehrlichia lotoris str. RAC413]|uniref:Putative membrane protein n=1 Tax=Candidatus Neoehrlichia procyonis str. RAC413 TaxID=1359163 RepID=A0A0F3NMH0_9RICK|nr:putative membrane protein [Candidatus Neoehrlichia lotoris str. RAC413]
MNKCKMLIQILLLILFVKYCGSILASGLILVVIASKLL